MIKMTFEAKLCPFCKKDNSCEVVASNSCWCMSIKIPKELIDLVPTSKKNKSCICKSCIYEFIKSPSSFKLKHSF